MPTKHTGGLSATNKHGESPFDIYCNALDFVMSSQSLDEDAATEVILNELGTYANEWQCSGIKSAAREIKAERQPLRIIDWRLAWLN